jgi:hypothetical protein
LHASKLNSDVYRFSAANVRHPNLEKHPKVERVQFYRARIEKGESLLIPIGWFHDVVSYSGSDSSYNVALNVFWKAGEVEFNRHKFLQMFSD